MPSDFDAGAEAAHSFVAEVMTTAKEDRADLAQVRRTLAGYVDRNIAACRTSSDERLRGLTAHEALHTLVEIARDDGHSQLERTCEVMREFDEEVSTGCIPGVPVDGEERRAGAFAAAEQPAEAAVSRLLLGGAFESLLSLDSHALFEAIREFEASARKAGRLTDQLRVFMGRIARVVMVCHELDRLAPLVDVELVIQAWWALLDALVALAVLADQSPAAAELVSAELVPAEPWDHPPPMRVLEPPCPTGAALAPPLGLRVGATSWLDACRSREGLMPAA
ncbi:MAG TPA: hypothetical protein VFA11_10065 [Acidimicrobiales bacterium]|nr:hypothetical protein [Acidimicrobiales bacterium]